MIRKLAIRPKEPSVSLQASEEALTFVFDCPAIEPRRLDPEALMAHPDLVQIPEPYETEAALGLALGLAIRIHTPPEKVADQRRMADAIAKVLLRLCRVHPDITMRAVNTAKDASRAGFPVPVVTSREGSLIIPVVVRLVEDPVFRKLIDER